MSYLTVVSAFGRHCGHTTQLRGSQWGGSFYSYQSAKILALLRLSVNFFQLLLTTKLKINFFCFKELNINKPVFFYV